MIWYNPNDPSVVAAREISELMSQPIEEIVEKIRNACYDVSRATSEAMDALYRALQRWIDDQIDVPGLAELINWGLDRLRELMPNLNRELDAMCDYFAEEVVPWLLSPKAFRQAATQWSSVASTATTMSKHINNSSEASKDADHNWTGAGADQYKETCTRQAECAEGLRGGIDALPGLLIGIAQGIEGQVLAMGGVVVATVGAIVTCVAGLVTGPGAVAAAVFAIIEVIVGLVAAALGIVEALVALVHTAENQAEELRQQTESMLRAASAEMNYWHKPGAGVGGGGLAPGTSGWDDGL